MERLKNSNEWIDAFYYRNFKDQNTTLNSIRESLKFRHEIGANGMDDLNQNYKYYKKLKFSFANRSFTESQLSC